MSKKMLVISPHSDDAIFSIGSYISYRESVTIISPFMGIPDDEIGRVKHETLKQEHSEACKIIEADHVDGDFLDDVYPNLNLDRLKEWLFTQVSSASKFDEIYIPLGIHHHDHILVSDFMLDILEELDVKSFWVYEEFPYRKLYDVESKNRLTKLEEGFGLALPRQEVSYNGLKDKAVRAYDSQIDETLISILKNPEKMYRFSP